MPQTIQRSFTSGEIAPALQSRADLTKYATGLNVCENFFTRVQGGAYSRPGFRYVGTLLNADAKGRLIPFSFNTEQNYILVFENTKITFVKEGGFIAHPTLDPLPYFVTTPYTEAQIAELSFAQNADVMTIVHPDHDPMNLSRLADDNWSLTTVSYTPTVTNPNAPVLSTVGAGAGTHSKKYTYVITAVNAAGVESLASPTASLTTPSLSTTAGIRLTWTPVAGAVYYRVYKDPSSDTDVYGWVGDSNTTTFDDYNLAPITSDAPPSDRQPFSAVDSKPSVVTYYQQRQVFANTHDEPQTVFTTQVNNYNSFRASNPSRDDDAVTFTIAAQQVNEIRHMLALDSLVLLTSGGEWIVSEGSNNVLTPSTIGVRIQSYNGASIVPPVVVNSTALYLQEKGSRLRDLGYEFSSDKYTGADLSVMSEHLFEGHTITSMAYAAEPYSIVWCVRDDGVLLGLTYQREQQVIGWHKHVTDGLFESIAVISEDGRDALYTIVKRTINGVDKRFVERLEKRESTNVEDAFYVDSGLSYDGVPVTTLGGLFHLDGATVTILADGNVQPDQVVVNDQITLSRPASKVHVGLKYTPVLETLDIDAQSSVETLKGKSVSISKVILETEMSRGGYVGPKKDDGSVSFMSEIKPRFDFNGYDTLPLTSDKKEVILDPIWSKGGKIRIEQRDPLPLTVLSVIPQVDIGGY